MHLQGLEFLERPVSSPTSRSCWLLHSLFIQALPEVSEVQLWLGCRVRSGFCLCHRTLAQWQNGRAWHSPAQVSSFLCSQVVHPLSQQLASSYLVSSGHSCLPLSKQSCPLQWRQMQQALHPSKQFALCQTSCHRQTFGNPDLS